LLLPPLIAVFRWDDDVGDLTCDDTWRRIVLGTAQTNTSNLEYAFDAFSWDSCGTLEHARVGLGIGREVREYDEEEN
jgi:hypothetical protein